MIAGILKELGGNNIALFAMVIAGICGAFLKSFFNPENKLDVRLRHMAGGLITTLFIGPYIGFALNLILREKLRTETISFLAAGFISGYLGLQLVTIMESWLKNWRK